MRHQQLFGFSVFFLILGFALPAFAGNWGENWGEMTWGSVAAVPTLGWLGLVLLLALLVVTVFWKMKRVSLQAGVTLSVFLLVPFLMAPHITTWEGLTWYTFINGEPADANEVNGNFEALADALDVTVPNSFANSGIADANEINSNFEALKTAVDTFTSNAAAATAATDTAFSNGVASVDITTDNAAAYASGVASVDITTDNAAAYASGVASVDITTDNAAAEAAAASAACTQAGGTWGAGTSTCTPALSNEYNCHVAGFCATVARHWPPGQFGYTNVYEGHTPETEPAAGCNQSPGSYEWIGGGMMAENGCRYASCNQYPFIPFNQSPLGLSNEIYPTWPSFGCEQ